MKIPKPFLFLFAALLALGALHPSHARAQVSVSFFYDNLDPYGEWVDDPDYGYCWHPTDVSETWAPYTDGYWAYTDAGWTWVSYEDYGGIVYHYGRWARLPGEGWVWVPGTTWAPAWVSWRSNDDYVGWAPLPPEARWRVDIGFGGSVDARFDIGPGFYSFVNVGNFGAPALGAVIVNREQNVNIINNTTNITNITVNNSNVYTGGPNYATIAARSTRPIPTLKLVRQGSAGAIRGANGKILSHQQGNQLMVLAPKVTAPEGGKFPAPHKVAKTLTGVKADHGWSGVTDPAQRQALETKFKSEGGSASAKPVNPEDLKVVTDKAKGTVPPKTSFADQEGLKGNKTPKSKTLSNTDLANAPATDEGAAAPESTPKGKSKKNHALATPADDMSGTGSETKKQKEFESASGSGDETPAPKIKKSKKAKTPSDFDSESTESSKHSNGDSNLQPFMGGDNPEPKSKKSSEYSDESPKNSQYSDEEKGFKGGPNGEEPGSGKKGKKKGKGEGEPTPPQ